MGRGGLYPQTGGAEDRHGHDERHCADDCPPFLAVKWEGDLAQRLTIVHRDDHIILQARTEAKF